MAIEANVKAGLSSENEYAGTGITHFIEHMIFKGTPKRKTGQIEKEIKSYGGYMNAATGLDTTSFFVTVPKEHFNKALELLSDCLMNPVFDEVELEKERAVILNEIKMQNDDPASRVIRLLFENAYISNPYRYPIIGYEELLKILKRENLVLYHEKYYVPNNMVLSIAGNIDVDKALDYARESFGKNIRKTPPSSIYRPESEQISYREYEGKAEVNLGYFAMAYHSTELSDKNLYPMDILAMALGMGDSSRLNRVLVKDKEMLYTVSSTNYTPLKPGLFMITGIGEKDKLRESVAEIEKEIEKIKNEGISPDEYDKAKANTVSGYLESLETVQSQASSMAVGETLLGDPDFAKKYVEGLKNTTLDDVKKAANKYLNHNNLTVVYLTGGYVEEEPTVKKEEIKKYTAKKYVLKNGIRVILKREPELPLVSISYSNLGGLLVESAENNGICRLMSEMLLKGTKTKPESEIKGAMERIGASINSYSGMNGFGITIKCMSNDIVFSLSLLEDVIKNPYFPESELEKIKKLAIADIKSEDDDIFQKGFYEFKKGLFKNHPYGRRPEGEMQTVSNIKRGDILNFYKTVSNPENSVITVVGDFEEEGTFDFISKHFSDIKGSLFKISVKDSEPLKGPEEKILHMPKEEALFILGFKGPDIKGNDKYTMDIISSVMSGSDGRLFHSVRNAIGLSYTQGTSTVYGLSPGYFLFYVASDKKDIDKAKNIILQEIAKIKKNPVTDEELNAAKNSLIGSHAISMQTNDAKSFTMALDELYSLGYENYLHYKENIEKCTKSDIMRVSNKYFDLDKSFSVIILPEK